MPEKKILIIVPAYNEQGNIGRTIDEIISFRKDVDVLVVDDGSSDSTLFEASSKGVNVVSLPFNLGIGGAVQTGFKFASERKYDIAVQVDGDGQHEVKFIDVLLRPLFECQADVVIGSRFLNPKAHYHSSFIRKLGIDFFAHLISFLTQCRITDSTSGFRAYNQKAISVFSNYYPHDYPEPEAIVVAKRVGLKIVEVPVEMRKRAAGHSSIRYLMTLYYMVKVTFAILLNIIKK